MSARTVDPSRIMDECNCPTKKKQKQKKTKKKKKEKKHHQKTTNTKQKKKKKNQPCGEHVNLAGVDRNFKGLGGERKIHSYEKGESAGSFARSMFARGWLLSALPFSSFEIGREEPSRKGSLGVFWHS